MFARISDLRDLVVRRRARVRPTCGQHAVGVCLAAARLHAVVDPDGEHVARRRFGRVGADGGPGASLRGEARPHRHRLGEVIDDPVVFEPVGGAQIVGFAGRQDVGFARLAVHGDRTAERALVDRGEDRPGRVVAPDPVAEAHETVVEIKPRLPSAETVAVDLHDRDAVFAVAHPAHERAAARRRPGRRVGRLEGRGPRQTPPVPDRGDVAVLAAVAQDARQAVGRRARGGVFLGTP